MSLPEGLPAEDPNEYTAHYAFMREARVAFADCLRNCLALNQSSVEIEGRLGSLSGDGFRGGVGKEAHARVEEVLSGYSGWTRVQDWVETRDVYYEIRVEGGSVKQVRTEVSAHDNTIKCKHVVKTPLEKVDLVLRRTDGETENLPFQIDARVCVSTEEALQENCIPCAVCPKHVRVKQRKSFFLRSNGAGEETFRFDITRVWAGSTYKEAERKQMEKSDPLYEIEVECMSPLAYLASCEGDYACLALSLLMKLQDILVAINKKQAITFLPASGRGR